MNKYLYVEFSDAQTYWMFQGEMPIHRRVVKVELTPEQIKQLQPRVVGSSVGQEFHEDIRLISLQDD